MLGTFLDKVTTMQNTQMKWNCGTESPLNRLLFLGQKFSPANILFIFH